MTVEENQQRYLAALSGMQSGVAMKMNYSPSETTPKHLRVGVNSAFVNTFALHRLLVDKGIITEEEYTEAVAVAMEQERDRYQKWLQERIVPEGSPTVIDLG